MIVKDGFLIDEARVDRKMLPAGFTEETMNLPAITELNN
jgi:hypothetical protein